MKKTAIELWDAYYENGTPANKDLVRGQPIPEGLYHLVSEVLVRHADGDYLLMQRDPRKPHFGVFFEATAGGSALKGEDGLSCAKRELLEETGISDGRLTALGRTLSKEAIYCVFLCLTDCDKGAITLQEGETVSYKWLSEKDFVSFVNSKEMIPQQRERFRSYFEKMGYLD